MTVALSLPQRRRILMLTTDERIDRRILHEGETLIDAGHEVILLAAGNACLPVHEVIGRVKVHRLMLSAPVSQSPQAANRPRQQFWRRAGRFGLRLVRRLTIQPVLRMSRKLAAVLRRLTRRRGPFSQRSPLEHLYYRTGLVYRPDIIHAHDLPMLPVAAQLKAALNVPLVYDMHESYPDQNTLTPFQQRMLRREEKQFIGCADVAITVNELLLDVLRRRYGLTCCGVVQNATTTAGFDAGLRYDRFREDYPHLKGKFLVLYQGWIARDRNLETAIRAMAKVAQPDLVLLIMGYGEYADELKVLVAAEGVTDRVLFVPAKSQEELLSYSASADIGLIAYCKNLDLNTHFRSPNRLYEFIAARLPILSNHLPFVELVLDKWGFGMVANLDTVAAFAATLDGLDRGKLATYRERLARDGWRFSWEEEQKQLLALYARLPGAESMRQAAAA